MSLAHETLENYFQLNFILMQEYKYSLTELDDMMPWEREIYTTLLQQHIEKRNDAVKAQNDKMQRQAKGR